MQPLGTKKITQPLGTKQNYKTSQYKKKSCNLSGQINNATSWGKKSNNLLGSKNNKNSSDKKFHNLLEQKQITQSLGTTIIHATSWDKQII